MSDFEKNFFRLLLVADAAAIVISAVAGPLSHTAVATGAAASAILISLCLLFYGLWAWPGKKP